MCEERERQAQGWYKKTIRIPSNNGAGIGLPHKKKGVRRASVVLSRSIRAYAIVTLSLGKGPPSEAPGGLTPEKNTQGGPSRPRAGWVRPVVPPLQVCVLFWVVDLRVRTNALSPPWAPLHLPHHPIPTIEVASIGGHVEDRTGAARQPVGGPRYNRILS